MTPLVIVKGPQSLRAELGVTNALFLSTPGDRAIQVAYERTFKDLLSLEITALSRQLVRMETHQRVGEEDAEPNAVLVDSVHKADIQKTMVSTSTQKSGFILWLDFDRDSAADVEVLLKRPPLLLKLDGNSSGGRRFRR